MAIEIYLPQLGLTMTEGTVMRWLKAAGDAVKRGEPLVEIETDKVTTEIEAPADGVLGRILVEAGSTALIGGVLTHVLVAGEAQPQVAAAASVAATPTAVLAPQVAERAMANLSGHSLANFSTISMRVSASAFAPPSFSYSAGI